MHIARCTNCKNDKFCFRFPLPTQGAHNTLNSGLFLEEPDPWDGGVGVL